MGSDGDQSSCSLLFWKGSNLTQFTQAKDYLGKSVSVQVDRPLGSRHPRFNYIYPINYGYIPGTLSADGEELDAYIIGVFEPVRDFTGTCIAVIHRLNDDEDKLVVVPEGKDYSDEQIRSQIEFQEKFFVSNILHLS